MIDDTTETVIELSRKLAVMTAQRDLLLHVCKMVVEDLQISRLEAVIASIEKGQGV